VPRTTAPHRRGARAMGRGVSSLCPLRGAYGDVAVVAWSGSFVLCSVVAMAALGSTGDEQASTCVNACAPDGSCTCISPPRAATPKLAIASCAARELERGEACEMGSVPGFDGKFAAALLQGRRIQQEDVIQVAAVSRRRPQTSGTRLDGVNGAGGPGDEDQVRFPSACSKLHAAGTACPFVLSVGQTCVDVGVCLGAGISLFRLRRACGVARRGGGGGAAARPCGGAPLGGRAAF